MAPSSQVWSGGFSIPESWGAPSSFYGERLSKERYGAGVGDTTQQGAATTVSQSLQQSAALATAVGGPIAGAAVEAAAALAKIVSLFGPSPWNTYTTEVVNQVEADVMQPNLKGWDALSDAEKTPANQAAFEANFNSGWQYVLNACNNPQLGTSGIHCISDRQRGGKFDWWALYYDPIANDPAVAANIAAAQAAAAAASTNPAVTPAASTNTAGGQAGGAAAPATTSNPYLWGGLAVLAVGVLVFAVGGD